MTDVSLELLCRFVTKFNGNKDDLPSFIRNCDNAYNLASETQRPILFSFFQTQVSGKADLVASTRDLGDWPSYKTFLVENFSTQKSFAQLLCELQACKQYPGESVVEFTQRVENCYTNLIRSVKLDTQEQQKLSGKLEMVANIALVTFITGCKTEYQTILRARNPSSFESASEFALEEEKILNFQRKLKSANIKKCDVCGKTNHTALNCYKNSFGNHNFPKNTQKPIKREIFNVKPDLGKICNYCKKPGHLISECFKRERIYGKFKPHPNRNLNSNLTGTAAVSREAKFFQAEAYYLKQINHQLS
jgi:hypothetical protein